MPLKLSAVGTISPSVFKGYHFPQTLITKFAETLALDLEGLIPWRADPMGTRAGR